jgi:hypothetical protein
VPGGRRVDHGEQRRGTVKQRSDGTDKAAAWVGDQAPWFWRYARSIAGHPLGDCGGLTRRGSCGVPGAGMLVWESGDVGKLARWVCGESSGGADGVGASEALRRRPLAS